MERSDTCFSAYIFLLTTGDIDPGTCPLWIYAPEFTYRHSYDYYNGLQWWPSAYIIRVHVGVDISNIKASCMVAVSAYLLA